MIGPTLGIASETSSRDKTVWFSTEFKKSIVSAKFSVDILKAFCKAIVVFRAWS